MSPAEARRWVERHRGHETTVSGKCRTCERSELQSRHPGHELTPSGMCLTCAQKWDDRLREFDEANARVARISSPVERAKVRTTILSVNTRTQREIRKAVKATPPPPAPKPADRVAEIERRREAGLRRALNRRCEWERLDAERRQRSEGR